MNKIHILSERVANKIAAGEVVERPASIVKELLENSLDSGATAIEVSVTHGGKSLIRIVDNGCGMSSQDAELAFKRHATSKIKSDEDLANIISFGFRGEALPSIAAVSRMTLVTRPADSETGTEIWMVGGALAKARECSASIGTTVEVRDLFFNTPARRKFLKQDATEYGHIHETLAAAALAHLHVHFIFKNQDKTVWNLPAGQNLNDRVRGVLGEDWGDMVIPVEAQIPHVTFKGLITKPEFARGNRMTQYVFINHRWVKSFAMSYALEAGYQGFLMHGRYPAAVLFLEVHPEYVDVNVHPTKQQVRISGEASIKSMVQNAVASALHEAPDLRPTLFDRRPVAELTPVTENHEIEGRNLRPNPKDSLLNPVHPMESEEVSAVSKNSWESLLKQSVQPALTLNEKEAVWGENRRFTITKVLGQIHGTFVLVETDEGYAVIDQHAAHEKIQYESLKKNFEKAQPVSQKLLIEEMLEIHPRHVAVFEDTAEFLNKIGFEVELFGEKTLIIRAIPSALQDENPKQILSTFFEQKETGESGVHLEHYREDLAAMLACKTRSVKAHDALTLEELRALVDELMRCDEPFHCPHGRPSMLKYSFGELERQFKRKL